MDSVSKKQVKRIAIFSLTLGILILAGILITFQKPEIVGRASALPTNNIEISKQNNPNIPYIISAFILSLVCMVFIVYELEIHKKKK